MCPDGILEAVPRLRPRFPRFQGNYQWLPHWDGKKVRILLFIRKTDPFPVGFCPKFVSGLLQFPGKLLTFHKGSCISGKYRI